jgi:RecB family endonuclease NucS
MSERVYLVDPATKQLTAVEPVALTSVGVKERQDLEAWAISRPEIFGEPLLVITSEFDQFDRSDRRLDILALDEDGCLVVIELKLALSRASVRRRNVGPTLGYGRVPHSLGLPARQRRIA